MGKADTGKPERFLYLTEIIMELRHLRYFIAVAEERHIGRAASRLHISQPPLTRQIQKLEEELGVQLFIRTSKGMELTPAGELFLEEARNIRSAVQQAAERTQRAGQGRLGRLDIGIFGSAILDSIPAILLKFRESFPDVEVALHNMDKNMQLDALRQRRIDIAFNRFITPVHGIENEVVLTEQILIALNTSHPLANEPALPFNVLRSNPLIVYPTGGRPSFIDKVISLCAQRGFMPNIAQEVGDALNGVALVSSNFGICPVPESAAKLNLHGVVYRPLLDPPENATLKLNCFYRSNDQSPLLQSFLQVVRTFRDH